MTTIQDTVGDVLREWRHRRRMSQLDLAGNAALSTRHLSCVENGRATGSRDVLLRLADRLGMPLRAQNRLLLAGGYAPMHPERPLEAPDMAFARAAIDAVLEAHTPYPALAVDRHWQLVSANTAIAALLADVAAELLEPPVNVLRLTLHPGGLAPRIENLAEWRHHVLDRLRVQADTAGDPVLAALHAELRALPGRAGRSPPRPPGPVAIPLELRDPARGIVLRFLSTTTVFGTATDVTLAEIAIEAFLPADAATRAALQGKAP